MPRNAQERRMIQASSEARISTALWKCGDMRCIRLALSRQVRTPVPFKARSLQVCTRSEFGQPPSTDAYLRTPLASPLVALPRGVQQRAIRDVPRSGNLMPRDQVSLFPCRWPSRIPPADSLRHHRAEVRLSSQHHSCQE